MNKQIVAIMALVFTFAVASCRTQPSPEVINNGKAPIEDPIDLNDNEQYQKNIYFNNIIFDPDMLDCSNVYPVERFLNDQNDYEGIISLLIEGPSSEEIREGYVSNLPPNTLLNQIVIENKTAFIDFDILQVGGSCATMAVEAQINSTLIQFDEIDEVIISIQGQTEGVLEP